MSKSTSTSATPTKVSRATGAPRPRRKTKSVAKPIQLTPAMISYHAEQRAGWEFVHFVDNYGKRHESERRIIGHLIPAKFPSKLAFMKEVRRLLGESLAKCKVIPFPIERIRKSQSAMEV